MNATTKRVIKEYAVWVVQITVIAVLAGYFFTWAASAAIKSLPGSLLPKITIVEKSCGQ